MLKSNQNFSWFLSMICLIPVGSLIYSRRRSTKIWFRVWGMKQKDRGCLITWNLWLNISLIRWGRIFMLSFASPQWVIRWEFDQESSLVLSIIPQLIGSTLGRRMHWLMWLTDSYRTLNWIQTIWERISRWSCPRCIFQLTMPIKSSGNWKEDTITQRQNPT